MKNRPNPNPDPTPVPAPETPLEKDLRLAYEGDTDPKKSEIGAVFYGNERTNGAWAKLADGAALADKINGPRLGVLAVVARRDGARRAGLVGGTDLVGMRLTNQLPYFVSGVAYPEWFVVGPEAVLNGIRGVRGAGWFSDGGGAAATR